MGDPGVSIQMEPSKHILFIFIIIYDFEFHSFDALFGMDSRN